VRIESESLTHLFGGNRTLTLGLCETRFAYKVDTTLYY